MIYHDDHDYRDDLLLRGNRVSSFHSSLWRANGKKRNNSRKYWEKERNLRKIGEKRRSKSFTLQSSNIRWKSPPRREGETPSSLGSVIVKVLPRVSKVLIFSIYHQFTQVLIWGETPSSLGSVIFFLFNFHKSWSSPLFFNSQFLI